MQLADADGNRISTPSADSLVSVACEADPATTTAALGHITRFGTLPGTFCATPPTLQSNTGGVWHWRVSVGAPLRRRHHRFL